MSVRTRLDKLMLQYDAIELINLARSLLRLSYREMSEILGIPDSMLCRYANGDLLPSVETAKKIVSKLESVLSLEDILRRNIRCLEGYCNFTELVLSSSVLKLYARRVRQKFGGQGVNKVLTAATDGVPLAVAAALALGAELAIAKQYRDVFVEEFYESTLILEDPPRKVTLYLPRNILKRGDKILIVDDIVRTGRTVQALIDMCRKADACVVGVSILIALGSEWYSRLRCTDAKIDVVLQLPRETCLATCLERS